MTQQGANASGVLELSFYYDAPVERVFDAWLRPDWVEWLPPRSTSCRLVEMDPRAGGAYAVAMTMPDGRHVTISGQYRIVDRPILLVMTWVGDYDNLETLLEVGFIAEGNGTRMRIRHSGFTDASLRDGYGSGWSAELGTAEKLRRILMERVK